MSESGRRKRRPSAPGRLAFLVAQVGGLAAIRFAQRLASTGLSPAQAGVLRVVAADPGRTQRAVSDQLGLLPSRLVVLVDELERDGLLERRRDPDDRRNYGLSLTPTGQKALRGIGMVAQAHGEDFLAPLSATERETLSRLLTRLATHHDLSQDVHPGYRTLGRGRD
ncbi:MAG: MarR family winged helix-turn-helix transcriptional regulator [Actinomycetota bacterium]|nr:MarR family winged helix-turn-helix transcriptional regulator [Actinomycetota bacterium]